MASRLGGVGDPTTTVGDGWVGLVIFVGGGVSVGLPVGTGVSVGRGVGVRLAVGLGREQNGTFGKYVGQKTKYAAAEPPNKNSAPTATSIPANESANVSLRPRL